MDRSPELKDRLKRTLLGVVWAAAAIVLVVDVVWLALSNRMRTETRAPVLEAERPVERGTSASGPLSGPATVPPRAEQATGPPAAAAKPEARRDDVRGSGRIAYRLGTTLYVANEDGSQPSPVARVAEGPYALSPDGLTLAVVADGRLTLLDTGSGAAVDVGPAIEEQPVWMPDSHTVLFVRRAGHAEEVRRVGRDGTGGTAVHAGSGVSVSPNGRVIVVRGGSVSTQTDDHVWVSTGGSRFRRVRVTGGFVTAIAAGDRRIYVGVADAEGRAWIEVMAPDGSSARRLSEGPLDDERADWGQLCLSPDGRHLGAVAVGDDGYSRISIIRLADGAVVRVLTRRDAYPRCWSASGDHLYYIEGNAYQGEPTALYRVAPDGAGRRLIATGAR